MLLVALRAIRHERWASLHFYSVRGYVYTDKGKKQIWPPSAMSDSSQLWPRSSAAAGSCGIPLLGKHRHPAEGGSWSITTYPAACNSHPPCNWDIKTPWMDLSFIIREYITWASQILLVSSEGTLFPLETFPSCTSCSMYPLFLATLFSIKTVGSGTSFYLHLHTACSIENFGIYCISGSQRTANLINVTTVGYFFWAIPCDYLQIPVYCLIHLT